MLRAETIKQHRERLFSLLKIRFYYSNIFYPLEPWLKAFCTIQVFLAQLSQFTCMWQYLFSSPTRARLSTSRESLACHGFYSIKSRINNTLCCPGTCANTWSDCNKEQTIKDNTAHKHRLYTNSTFSSYHCNRLESPCWHQKPEINSEPSIKYIMHQD